MSWARRYYWPRIRRAILRGRTARALKLARHYVRFYPRDTNAWKTMAVVLARTDGPDPGEALKQAVEHYSSPALYQELITLLLGRGQVEDARLVLDELTHKYPNSPSTELGRADLAIHEARWDQALLVLNRLLSFPRLPPIVLYEVAKRMVDIPDQRVRAVELLSAFVDKVPRDPLAHMMLAVLLQNTEPERALRHTNSARKALGREAGRLEEGIRALSDRLGRDTPGRGPVVRPGSAQ